MLSLKTLKPHLFYRLLKHQKPSLFTQPPPHILSQPREPIKWIAPLSQRTFFSTEIQLVSDPDNKGVKSKKPKKGKKPLDVPVKEAVRLSEKVEGESESKKRKKSLEGLLKEPLGVSEKVEGESEKEGLDEEEGLSETNEPKKGKKALDVPLKEAARLSEKVEGESECKKQKKRGKKSLGGLSKEPLGVSEQVEGERETEELSSSLTREMRSKKQKKGKKPLDVLFKEAVGLSEKVEGESETEEEEGLSKKLEETNELKKKLEKIEREVISMKGELKDRKTKKKTMKKIESVSVEGSKQVSLYSLFASNPKRSESDSRQTEKSVVSEEEQGHGYVELKPIEELSPDTVLLVKHLHEKGYLKDANFLRSHKLDLSCFSTLYSRNYLRCAAERFGKDHREEAKCLSEIDLKRLALFGCPSVDKKTVFAAKRLRSYFNIQEDIICRPCKLIYSCQFKNHTVGRKASDLYIVDVMKILTLYALEMVPPQLIIPDEVKDAVSRLLKQVVKLGNT